MGYFTELFARNRTPEAVRYRNALAMFDAMSPAERADIGIKPADFPRLAREMSARGR
jgi:hypothetical protein